METQKDASPYQVSGQRLALIFGFFAFIASFIALDEAQELKRVRARLAEVELALTPGQNAQKAERTGVAGDLRAVRNPSPAPDPRSLPGFITKEDREQALALNERERKGEYVLKFERTADRKSMDVTVKNLAAQMGANRAPELDRVFSQFGLSPEGIKQLEQHSEKIGLASLETETAMQQLYLARQSYDARVRSLLSPDDYAKYRQYEDSQPAARERAQLTAFAQQHGIFMDPTQEQQIEDLIRDTQSFTQDAWHGPYDDLPRLAVGSDMVIGQLEAQIKQAQQTSSALRQRAADAGLPSQYLDMLANYYAAAIQSKQAIIQNVKNAAAPNSFAGAP